MFSSSAGIATVRSLVNASGGGAACFGGTATGEIVVGEMGGCAWATIGGEGDGDVICAAGTGSPG
jgi:hypothetical protein